MSLVESAVVPSFLRGAYIDDDVDGALSWASSAVESYCERSFTQVLADQIRIDPFPDGTALLPNPPVTNISLLEGFLPSNGAMAWVTLTNYDFTPDGMVWDTTSEVAVQPTDPYAPSWPFLPKSLRVTYDHGYITSGAGVNLPQPIIDAVIKAAVGYLVNPFSMAERKVGDATYRWAENGKTQLLDEALLGRFRLATI